LNTTADATIIDNRKLVYVPIRLACGVCAYCSPDVLRHCPMVLRSIQADLSGAFSMLPVSVHSLLRRTRIWLNYNGYAYGPKAHPRILRHVTTHHHPAWLVEFACDTPQKAVGIEIYSCVDFQNMRLHWNGSGLLLHELCHLIHQCCLEDGLENKTVESLYERADASGKYEKVLRRDWAGKTKATNANTTTNATTPIAADILERRSEPEPTTPLEEGKTKQPADSDLAYAMVDAKEFFAELSVAYFCNAYRSLDKADPNTMETCSPPLLHQDATRRIEILMLQRQLECQHQLECQRDSSHYQPDDYYTENYYRALGGREYQSIRNDSNNASTIDDKNSCCWAPFQPLTQFVRSIAPQQPLFLSSNNCNNGKSIVDGGISQLSQWRKMADPVFRERATSRNCSNISHCNKFYPFTRGQLKHHDPELFVNLRDLWREIAMWEDPFASTRAKKRLSRSCSRRCPNLVFLDC
jgi:hypothetical protein